MAKSKKKPMTPKEVEKVKDELRQLRLIRSYSRYRLPEDEKLKGIERATELVLADDSKMSDVVLLDLEGLSLERTKVLEMHKEVLSKDRIEAVTGLEKKQVKELLARGLSMESIEQLSMQVVADGGELEPEAIKDAIVIEAVEQGAIEPLPEDAALGLEVELDDPEAEDGLEFATLPGMEIVAMDDETQLAPADDEDALARIQEQTGVLVEEDPETGDVVVTTLEERMEITPEGGNFELVYKEALERELAELVEKYKKFGNVEELEAQLRQDLDKKLEGTEIVMDEDEKGELVLRAITRQEREEKEAQVDEEKRRIAEALGIDPAEILSIIRLKSVDAASEMTNMHLYDTNANIVVRLRNNNFKMLREVGEGTSPIEQRIDTPDGVKSYMEIQDYEINSVMREVAPALKDTAHRGYTDLLAGEVQAGKTRPESNIYDIIKIRRAGEAKMDDNDYLVYIGLTGDDRVADVVTNHGNGLDFDRDGVEITYPRDVCIQGKEYGIHDKDTAEHERETHNDGIDLDGALSKRIALLEELLAIEELINAEEQNTIPDPTIVAGQVLGGNGIKKGIEYSEESRQVRLDEAYSRRGEILLQLGYNESELQAAKDEAKRAMEAAKTIGPKGSLWS